MSIYKDNEDKDGFNNGYLGNRVGYGSPDYVAGDKAAGRDGFGNNVPPQASAPSSPHHGLGMAIIVGFVSLVILIQKGYEAILPYLKVLRYNRKTDHFIETGSPTFLDFVTIATHPFFFIVWVFLGGVIAYVLTKRWRNWGWVIGLLLVVALSYYIRLVVRGVTI